jgi:hypothetical protein
MRCGSDLLDRSEMGRGIGMAHSNPTLFRLSIAALTVLLASLAAVGISAAQTPVAISNDSLDSAFAHHYPKRDGQRARPAGGSLLFDGAKISDFGLIQAAPDAINEVPDPAGSGETVLKLTVDEADVAPITPTENPRAQALSPGLIDEGDEFWLATKFMLPEDMPSIPSWLGLVSVYGAPFDGPSPWCLEVNEDEFRWQRNGNYDWDIPWRAPLVKGEWVSILTHERFGSDGFVEMWIDGELVTFFEPGNHNPDDHPQTTRLEMATMDSSNYAAPNAAKIMQYRKIGMFESASVYFGDLELGSTRAAVER